MQHQVCTCSLCLFRLYNSFRYIYRKFRMVIGRRVYSQRERERASINVWYRTKRLRTWRLHQRFTCFACCAHPSSIWLTNSSTITRGDWPRSDTWTFGSGELHWGARVCGKKERIKEKSAEQVVVIPLLTLSLLLSSSCSCSPSASVTADE